MAWDSLKDCQGAQSQKEGQEDQGEIKELGGPSAVLRSSGPSGLPSGSALPGSPSSYPNPSNYLYVEACSSGLRIILYSLGYPLGRFVLASWPYKALKGFLRAL